METELYDFEDHLESIVWLDQLPKGLIKQTIDLRYNTVQITKHKLGFDIYIGPKNTQIEGTGILIKLNSDCDLIDYEIERIAPHKYKRI